MSHFSVLKASRAVGEKGGSLFWWGRLALIIMKNYDRAREKCIWTSDSWGSMWLPRLCLATAKIWSDGQILSPIKENKGLYILEEQGWANPKDELKRDLSPSRLPPFIHCLLPPKPALCKLDYQEGCSFYLRSSLRSLDLPLFYLHGLVPSLSFSYRHSGLLFPILTT